MIVCQSHSIDYDKLVPMTAETVMVVVYHHWYTENYKKIDLSNNYGSMEVGLWC